MDTLDRATLRNVLRRRTIAQRILKHGDEHDEKHHGNWATGRTGGGESKGGETQSTSGSEAETAAPDIAGSEASDGGEAAAGVEETMEDAKPTRAPASVLNELSMEIQEEPQYVQTMRENAKEIIGQRLGMVEKHAGWGQMSQSDEMQGTDTKGLYGDWENGKFQGWSEERSQFQADLLNEYKRRQIEENDGRAPKAERVAIVMAGLPGSGKSFTLKHSEALAAKFDLRDFLVINADDMKGLIAEHDFDALSEANPLPEGMDPLKPAEMASLVHEESSDMSKHLAKIERRLGTNIALDITAQNGQKTVDKHIQPLIDAGYTVHVVHVDVDLDEAEASALNRFANGMSKPSGGRPVPSAFLAGLKSETNNRLDKVNEAMEVYDQVVNGDMYWVRNFPVSGALSQEKNSDGTPKYPDIKPRKPVDLTDELEKLRQKDAA